MGERELDIARFGEDVLTVGGRGEGWLVVEVAVGGGAATKRILLLMRVLHWQS